MEKLFKNIKPNKYPIKTKLGYGCLRDKRKILRAYRKHGFDTSETWNLDRTIGGWLSDNVGGFFRRCGNVDAWDETDLDGNPIVFNKDTMDVCRQAYTARSFEFKRQLLDFIKNGDDTLYQQFINFVIPRLQFLKDNCTGYPGDYKSIDGWQATMQRMIDELPLRQPSTFVDQFFALWD